MGKSLLVLVALLNSERLLHINPPPNPAHADSVVVQTLPVSTSSTTKFTPENISTSTTGRSSAVTAKDDELVLSQHPDIDERGKVSSVHVHNM